jgi:hypothetical protein
MPAYIDLVVSATDAGGMSANATVRISIAAQNEYSPVCTATPTLYTYENRTDSEVVIDLSRYCSDGDSNNTLQGMLFYAMSDPTLPFVIDSATGVLTTVPVLDRETQASYTVSILVSDQDPQGARSAPELRVTVVLRDVNDNAPTFLPVLRAAFSVAEVGSANQLIGTIRATDPDAGSNGTAGLTFSTNMPQNFTFGAQSLSGSSVMESDLTVNGQLDREATDNGVINLEVRVTDGGGLFTTMTIQITVGDYNDNAPVFTQATYFFSIYENSPSVNPFAGSSVVVGSVLATDQDNLVNTTVTYRIVGVGSPRFSINNVTGEISQIVALDRETVGTYVLAIEANDNTYIGTSTQTRTATAGVLVSVLDVNDYTPTFSLSSYPLEVLENSPASTLLTNSASGNVATLTVLDADIGQNAFIDFSLHGDGAVNFGVTQPTAGSRTCTIVVSSNSTLDREAHPGVYTLTLSAADRGDPLLSSNTTLLIQLLDVSDTAPEFGSAMYTVSVDENDADASVSDWFTVSDADLGDDQPTYTIGPASAVGPFVVDVTTGSLSLTEACDREDVSSYTFWLTATDRGNNTGSTLVTVAINDVNDNAPLFAADSNVNRTMFEESFASFDFSVSDIDAGQNSVLVYSLDASQPASAGFAIAGVGGGVVRVSTTGVDRENPT